MTVSNSSSNIKLKFDDVVGLMLNEKVCKKVNRETSNAALNNEGRGKSSERNSRKSWSKSRREKNPKMEKKRVRWSVGIAEKKTLQERV